MNGRILALVGDTFHAPGGIAQYNRDLITAWSEMDDIEEVVIVPRFASGPDSPLPRKVVQQESAHRLFSYMLRAVITSRRRAPFDFVFCAHMNLTPLASLICGLLRIPLWLQVHGIEAWEQPARIVSRAAERAMLVTSVSRHTRRMFLGWANLAPDVVRILPNTVGERFSSEGEQNSALEKYGLAGKTILLTISRLSKLEAYKGHEKVLRCMPKLLSEYDDIVYVIGGDGDLRHELKKLARSLHVDDSVRFLGPIEHDELPSLYRGADVFVMPSSGEGFGIVYLESMACGTPVIAGNTDGAADPLQDGALGVLASEDEIFGAIRGALQSAKSATHGAEQNLNNAKSAVQSFGRPAFNSGVNALTNYLQSTVRT